jgi:hypothetical protein
MTGATTEGSRYDSDSGFRVSSLSIRLRPATVSRPFPTQEAETGHPTISSVHFWFSQSDFDW